MDERLFSDEIRERERRRRRKGLLWSFASFALHVAVFAAIVMMTPVKSLVFDKEKKKANPAEDLSADRIEQISDALSQARINELLRQLEALQAVLHNMDLMKEELQKDYDAFAGQSAPSIKEELAKMLDEADASLKKAQSEQAPMIAKVEKMLAEERMDLRDEKRARWLSDTAEALIENDGDKVGDAQARAGNALDRIQVQAQFGGFRKTADASEKVRDAQVEAATMQNQAQKEASDIAFRMGEYFWRARELSNGEKVLSDQRERLEKSRAERKDAEARLADATKRRDEAERARADAQAEEKRSREEAGRANEAAKAARADAQRLGGELRAARRALEHAKRERARGARAKGEGQSVEDIERKMREIEGKIAEQNRKAEESAAKAREWGAKAHASSAKAREQAHAFNDSRNRADREKHRFDSNGRSAEDASRRIADLEKKVAERKAAIKSIEEVRRAKVNEEQVEKLRRASKAQADIQARIDILRKILASDAPEQQKLAQENRKENELVTKDVAAMKMVDAYEIAKEIESAITESYKDIKATQTAIERKMSFEAAQKVTDVAKAVRMVANREAIEDSPRTKEALDRQKTAQAEVVREADSMVDTALAMMEEAMSIVRPDDSSKSAVKGGNPKTVEWLQQEDFEKRAQEDERQKRLAEMQAAADYQVAITAAAAESEAERAKDLTKVMEAVGEVNKNTEQAEPGASKKDENPQELLPGGVLVKLDGRMQDLVGGNVFRFAESAAEDGIPAKWAYVQDWYVIGPFPNPNRVNLRRKFPPESVVDLDATYVGKDGRTIKWEFMQTKNATPKESWSDDLKPEVVPFTAEEYGIWYAYAEVFADIACDRWIAVGSDDRSDIWVNDVPVWGSSNKLKSWRVDEGYRRIRLNKGRNRILVRVENGWRSLGWSVCISLEDGNPAK